jgi:hypothetical protein
MALQLSGEGMFEDRAAVEAKIRRTKDQLLVRTRPYAAPARRPLVTMACCRPFGRIWRA